MAFYRKQADLIIRNGTIVDGTGKLPFYADIAVRGGRIDYIGDLRGVNAAVEIDAAGKYVTPGFIDSHSHSDYTIWANPEAQSSVRQGVTTEIVGNCGFSKRSLMEGLPFDPRSEGIDCIYNLPGPVYPKGAVAATLDKLDKMGASINMAWLCGHNDLRAMAGSFGPEPTPAELRHMEAQLKEALDAGFIGFSTGLEFVPGNISKPAEIEHLAALVTDYDGNYCTHMRDEGTYIFEAVDEFLNVIRKTGLRGTISHLNVKYDNGVPNEYLERSMQMVKDAREKEHLNVYCDMLPTCFANGDAIAVLPPWLYENGWDEARRILRDPAGREKVKGDLCRYFRFLSYGQWDRLLYIQPPYRPEIWNVPFNELAKAAGRAPADYFLDIMAGAPSLEEAGKVGIQANVFHEQTMIDSVVRDPIYMWMTDSRTTVEEGPLAERTGNIQFYMSMTYFFTRYVRDLKAIPIEKALMKVSSMPAAHYRLKDRGE